MIDFPGKLACVLFVPGCNFHCPYCHNPSLVLNQVDPADSLTLGQAIDFLKERRGFLDGVVITGGEPTLQPKLASVCRRIQDLGYPVKLDTNGSRPEVIDTLLSMGSIDYIAMDIKTVPENYYPLIQSKSDAESILTSIELILNAGIAHEFRTTCIKPLVDDTVVARIARLIEGADLYVLQQVHTTQVLEPTFCQKADRRYDDQALETFRSIAAGLVKKCRVR